MIPLRIAGATRYLGAPADWRPDVDGDCAHLPVRDERFPDGARQMVSAWEPSLEEIAMLNAGGRVLLYVAGSVHPPVMIAVGAAPA